MIRHAFLLLSAHLIEAVPELNGAVWFFNRPLLDPLMEAQYRLPSAFIEFPSAVMLARERSGIQPANLTFRVHTLDAFTYDANDVVSALIIAEKVWIALDGFSAKLSALPEFAALAGTPQDIQVINTVSRIGIEADHDHADVAGNVQTFLANVNDLTLYLSKINAEVTPSLNITA